MEKKKVVKKATSLRLQTEILRRLKDSQLQGIEGGIRIWRPGFADDATPIYDDTAG